MHAYYEEDEPVGEVLGAYERGQHGVTSSARVQRMEWSDPPQPSQTVGNPTQVTVTADWSR